MAGDPHSPGACWCGQNHDLQDRALGRHWAGLCWCGTSHDQSVDYFTTVDLSLIMAWTLAEQSLGESEWFTVAGNRKRGYAIEAWREDPHLLTVQLASAYGKTLSEAATEITARLQGRGGVTGSDT